MHACKQHKLPPVNATSALLAVQVGEIFRVESNLIAELTIQLSPCWQHTQEWVGDNLSVAGKRQMYEASKAALGFCLQHPVTLTAC